MFYDSAPPEKTLDELVDCELLNNGPVRLSVGAVDVMNGNFHYFDTADARLDARHLMASASLPPGVPPIEFTGRLWWDGGTVANNQLAHAPHCKPRVLQALPGCPFAAARNPRTTLMAVAVT